MYIEDEMKNLKLSIKELNNFIENTVLHNNYIGGRIINNDFRDELLTTAEVSKILKCNRNFVGELLKSGLLPYILLGSKKVRRVSIEEFLKKYEGWDITDPYNPKLIIK